MALTKKTSMKVIGNSVINGTIAETYTAEIDSDNPKNMRLNAVQINKDLCKEHREECRKDKAQFDDAAYDLQDALLAKKAAETE